MSRGSALGATLQYKNVSYIELKNIKDFDFPYGESEDVDTTSHNDEEKSFEPGIIDPGTVEIPIVWDDTEASHVWVLANLHTTKQFKYTPKNGTAKEFLAVLQNLTAANPRGTGPKLRTLTLQLTDGTIA